MRRLFVTAICLLFLSGCGGPSPSAGEAGTAGTSDITLTIGRKLPLPVTEESLRAYYESPEGFDRQVSDLWELEEGFCVCSAARSDRSQEAVYRFDWVFAETGSCYPLLEGPYNPQMVKDISPGAISVEPADDPLHNLSAALDPALVDVTSGESLSGSGVVSAATVTVSPREYGLKWWPLIPEMGDGSPLTIPGGGSGAPQSLNGVYAGADTLDLLFDSLGQGRLPQIQLTYDPDTQELTLLCKNAPLNCQASASNLFIDSIRTEAVGEDTAVICTLTPPAVPDRSQYATSIALEEVHPDDLDRDEVLLRITFHSPRG